MKTTSKHIDLDPAECHTSFIKQPRLFSSSGQRARVLSSIVLATVLGSGCGQQNSEFEAQSTDTEYLAGEEMMEDSAIANSDIPVTESGAPVELEVQNLADTNEQILHVPAADIQIAGKKLLINASANFKVKDVVKSSHAIENIVYQQSGYVASSTISNVENDSRYFVQGDQDIILTTYNRQAEMIVRVPRVNVNKFLKQVQQQVAFLTEQTFSAQDVTLDIYREQLATQLSRDMADELSEERLNSQNVREQSSNVDAISATYAARQQQEYARLEQLNIADKVKYSTITLVFTQPDVSYKEITQNLDLIIEAEQPSFAQQVAQAFKEGWQMLREIVITMIRLWWLLVLAIIFYLICRVIKVVYRKFAKNRRVPQSKRRTPYSGSAKGEGIDTNNKNNKNNS